MVIEVVSNNLEGATTPTLHSFRDRASNARAPPRTRRRADAPVKRGWMTWLFACFMFTICGSVLCMDAVDYDSLYRNLVHEGSRIV